MTDLSTHLAALGDPIRFAIIERLLKIGERGAGALQRSLM